MWEGKSPHRTVTDDKATYHENIEKIMSLGIWRLGKYSFLSINPTRPVRPWDVNEWTNVDLVLAAQDGTGDCGNWLLSLWWAESRGISKKFKKIKNQYLHRCQPEWDKSSCPLLAPNPGLCVCYFSKRNYMIWLPSEGKEARAYAIALIQHLKTHPENNILISYSRHKYRGAKIPL